MGGGGESGLPQWLGPFESKRNRSGERRQKPPARQEAALCLGGEGLPLSSQMAWGSESMRPAPADREQKQGMETSSPAFEEPHPAIAAMPFPS